VITAKDEPRILEWAAKSRSPYLYTDLTIAFSTASGRSPAAPMGPLCYRGFPQGKLRSGRRLQNGGGRGPGDSDGPEIVGSHGARHAEDGRKPSIAQPSNHPNPSLQIGSRFDR
jgi:hypothetical protein